MGHQGRWKPYQVFRTARLLYVMKSFYSALTKEILIPLFKVSHYKCGVEWINMKTFMVNKDN